MLAGTMGRRKRREKASLLSFPFPSCPARSLFKALSGGESSQRLLTAIRSKYSMQAEVVVASHAEVL